MPKWHHKESADMLEMQSNMCTSTHPTQRVDSKADSISSRLATLPNAYYFQSWTCWNCEFASQIYVFACSSSLCRICQRWSGYQAWYQFLCRYADSWWLGQSVWCGNAANIHFEDYSTGFSDAATDEEHWPKDIGFWTLLSYISMYY